MGKPPEDRPNAPPNAAPQRRKERGAPIGGTDGTVGDDSSARGIDPPKPDPRHREEVVGQGSGETAGGSPVSAAGEGASAKRSVANDPAIEFDPAQLGGVSSNTPPSIPKHAQQNNLEEQITTGGEDTLELSLYLEHFNFDALTDELNRAREAAEKRVEKLLPPDAELDDQIVRDGRRLICLHGSATTGSKKRINYRWRLQTDAGLQLKLMNREKPHERLPNGLASFGSAMLMREGLGGCIRDLRDSLQVLRIRVVKIKVSRVDVCVDLADLPVEELSGPFQRCEYVSRGRKDSLFSEDLQVSEYRASRQTTGFTIGSASILLRVYDKLRETKHDREKRALLVARRWGYLPETATRVEYQLRREALKAYGVDTLDDWIDKRSSIIDHLATGWFRLTDGLVDRKHPERSLVLPLWEEVRRMFADWAGDKIDVELTPVPRREVDVEQLLKQIYGLSIGVLVLKQTEVKGTDDFTHEMNYLLLELAEKRDILADLRQKEFEYRLRRGQ